MKLSKNTAIVIVVLIVVSVFFLIRGGEVYSVTLEASADKQSYSSGDQVTLSLKLQNTGTETTCVSDNAQGNIKFTSLTRDGQPVVTRTVPADFLEALSELVKADLQKVEPGESLSISLPSSYDPGIGAQALYTSEVNGISTLTTFYNIEEPGNYEAQLTYEYPGAASDSCQAVFTGETNNATVNFVIE